MHFLREEYEETKRENYLREILRGTLGADYATTFKKPDFHHVPSEKFERLTEERKQEIYMDNVRGYQAFLALVLLADISLPLKIREYLFFTVQYCEKYLRGTLTAQDEKEREAFGFIAI